MKRLLLVLVLLMTAGSLFAAELKVTGDMYVRGSTYNNLALAEENEAMNSMFDYDLTINAAFIANEKATVFTRFAFDKNVIGTGYVADSAADPSVDNGLTLERAYINYKFAPFLQLNTGLMGGGQWASTFNDNEKNVTRVQFIGALSADMVFIATYEKRDETGGFTGLKDEEDGDTNVYYLASRLKFGQVTVLPLLIYGTQGIGYAGTTKALLTALNAGGFTEKNYDATTMGFQLGLNGDFGMFGFVSELGYTKADSDGFSDDLKATPDAVLLGAGLTADQIADLRSKDTTTYGFMIDVFAKVDALKAGLVFAYGSADVEDGSFNFGDDFDMYYVMDDFVSNTATGLAGFTAFKLYADYTMDKITAMAAFGYGYSNMEDDDASFMEFDLGASYAFDEATAYTVGFGYATTSDFEVVDVDADVWRLFHKVSVKF